MSLSKSKTWVPLYGIGRIIDHLQMRGFTYDEISRQTGTQDYLLKKAKRAYMRGDKKSVTDEEKVKGLTNISLKHRTPTPYTYVNTTMAKLARHKLQKLIDKGLTKRHIIRHMGISNTTMYNPHKHMTVATYNKIISGYEDLIYDANMEIGTPESTNVIRNRHISETKIKKQEKYIEPIRKYIKAHPDASPTEISRGVGIRLDFLNRINKNYHVLPPRNLSRHEKAKARKAAVIEYLKDHPDAKGKDIEKLLGVKKTTAYSILQRTKTYLQEQEEQALCHPTSSTQKSTEN